MEIGGFNWLDFVIIAVFLFYAVEGYHEGFVSKSLHFSGFLLSFLLALIFYSAIGTFLFNSFSLTRLLSNAIGFFLIAGISQFFLAFAFGKIADKVLVEERKKAIARFSPVNNILGILPGLASSYILLCFLLSLAIVLPVSLVVKNAVSNSRFASSLLAGTLGFEKSIQVVFGQEALESLVFFTIAPESKTTVNLRFTTENVWADENAEQAMLVMLNEERKSQGLQPLVFDIALTEVGRKHGEDMLKRGYFSHYSQEELSPYDRMSIANISYTFAGENLALAPNTKLAMQGLLKSPGHRANILSKDFHKVGIGVVDGGIYGKMFTQEFTD